MNHSFSHGSTTYPSPERCTCTRCKEYHDSCGSADFRQGDCDCGPELYCQDLLRAADRLSGSDARIYFGAEREKQFAEILRSEQRALSSEVSAPATPNATPIFTGGEHDVFECEMGRVCKRTVDGYYGRIIAEVNVLDERTFQNRVKLTLKPALPSEYLKRWAITYDIFGLPTAYLGVTHKNSGCPRIAVYQPYIDQNDDDQATLEDIREFMTKYGFERVDESKIVEGNFAQATWYRDRDGILVTDAHARNFRKESRTGTLIPVDLMISAVPEGGSKILTNPYRPWSPSSQEIYSGDANQLEMDLGL